MVVNRILFRTRAGCPWRDLPAEYGHWKTVCNRHRRWSLDGMWDKVLGRLRAGCEVEGTDWTLGADSTVVRAHQHAAGAQHALPAELLTGGRRRMTRIRPAAGPGGPGPLPWRAEHQDSPGRRPPVPPGHPDPHPRTAWRLPAVHPAAGAGPHCPPRQGTPTEPARPGNGRQGIILRSQPCLPGPPRHPCRHPGERGPEEEPPGPGTLRRAAVRLRSGRYKERNTVERCFSKLKQFRAVATRYDKRDFMYQGTVAVALIRIWLRDPVPGSTGTRPGVCQSRCDGQ